jgi:hypothetical protein
MLIENLFEECLATKRSWFFREVETLSLMHSTIMFAMFGIAPISMAISESTQMAAARNSPPRSDSKKSNKNPKFCDQGIQCKLSEEGEGKSQHQKPNLKSSNKNSSNQQQKTSTGAATATANNQSGKKITTTKSSATTLKPPAPGLLHQQQTDLFKSFNLDALSNGVVSFEPLRPCAEEVETQTDPVQILSLVEFSMMRSEIALLNEEKNQKHEERKEEEKRKETEDKCVSVTPYSIGMNLMRAACTQLGAIRTAERGVNVKLDGRNDQHRQEEVLESKNENHHHHQEQQTEKESLIHHDHHRQQEDEVTIVVMNNQNNNDDDENNNNQNILEDMVEYDDEDVQENCGIGDDDEQQKSSTTSTTRRHSRNFFMTAPTVSSQNKQNEEIFRKKDATTTASRRISTTSSAHNSSHKVVVVGETFFNNSNNNNNNNQFFQSVPLSAAELEKLGQSSNNLTVNNTNPSGRSSVVTGVSDRKRRGSPVAPLMSNSQILADYVPKSYWNDQNQNDDQQQQRVTFSLHQSTQTTAVDFADDEQVVKKIIEQYRTKNHFDQQETSLEAFFKKEQKQQVDRQRNVNFSTPSKNNNNDNVSTKNNNEENNSSFSSLIQQQQQLQQQLQQQQKLPLLVERIEKAFKELAVAVISKSAAYRAAVLDRYGLDVSKPLEWTEQRLKSTSTRLLQLAEGSLDLADAIWLTSSSSSSSSNSKTLQKNSNNDNNNNAKNKINNNNQSVDLGEETTDETKNSKNSNNKSHLATLLAQSAADHQNSEIVDESRRAVMEILSKKKLFGPSIRSLEDTFVVGGDSSNLAAVDSSSFPLVAHEKMFSISALPIIQAANLDSRRDRERMERLKRLMEIPSENSDEVQNSMMKKNNNQHQNPASSPSVTTKSIFASAINNNNNKSDEQEQEIVANDFVQKQKLLHRSLLTVNDATANATFPLTPPPRLRRHQALIQYVVDQHQNDEKFVIPNEQKEGDKKNSVNNKDNNNKLIEVPGVRISESPSRRREKNEQEIVIEQQHDSPEHASSSRRRNLILDLSTANNSNNNQESISSPVGATATTVALTSVLDVEKLIAGEKAFFHNLPTSIQIVERRKSDLQQREEQELKKYPQVMSVDDEAFFHHHQQQQQNDLSSFFSHLREKSHSSSSPSSLLHQQQQQPGQYAAKSSVSNTATKRMKLIHLQKQQQKK